jgi:hypothetical protein
VFAQLFPRSSASRSACTPARECLAQNAEFFLERISVEHVDRYGRDFEARPREIAAQFEAFNAKVYGRSC